MSKNSSRIFTINISNIMNLCLQTMLYLEDISNSKDTPLEKPGCIYLYYWLYKEYKEKTNIENIHRLYQSLLKHFSYEDGEYVAPKIFDNEKGYDEDDELMNIVDIYYIKETLEEIKYNKYCYTNNRCDCAWECAKKYERLKHLCSLNCDDDIHNELEDLKNKFINLGLTTGCDNVKEIIFPPSQNFSQRMPSARKNAAHRFIVPTILII
ncbi:hypothetical protein PGO_003685, partial [Plasmodium gonderi]